MSQELSLRWWPESCDLREENESGSRMRRITAAPAITHNIYHEQPRCSADGNRLALFRTLDGGHQIPGNLLVYDIARYKLAYLEYCSTDLENGVRGIATASWSGMLFAARERPGSTQLLRFDLNTLEREELFDWGDLPRFGLQTISADGRWGLTLQRIENRTFGIVRVDLQNGTHELIHENPNIVNPHLQYRLNTAGRIMVQENRGCVVDATGNVVRPFDERGVGLYTIKADGSDRRDFAVGPPITPATTGHECWIGDTDHVLVTLSGTYNDGQRTGNVLEVRHEWEKPRVVFDSPLVWNHIAASRCGKYFIVDSYDEPEVPIRIGNIESGKTRVLCNAQTSGGGAQYTHAHPYMTSDNKWVVFNSDRTGLPQVYIASVPDGFLASLG